MINNGLKIDCVLCIKTNQHQQKVKTCSKYHPNDNKSGNEKRKTRSQVQIDIYEMKMLWNNHESKEKKTNKQWTRNKNHGHKNETNDGE